jgi:hypothetical protein
MGLDYPEAFECVQQAFKGSLSQDVKNSTKEDSCDGIQ